MRNKKILNICLLTFGLLALFTFILPISKYGFVNDESGFVNVMFYLLNAIMILSLVALVVFAIINLFKDNYQFVKLMEVMALLGFIMVFMVMLIFACSSYARINIGYLLVAIEMFACANFSQIARLVGSSKEIKTGFSTKKCGCQKQLENQSEKDHTQQKQTSSSNKNNNLKSQNNEKQNNEKQNNEKQNNSQAETNSDKSNG